MMLNSLAKEASKKDKIAMKNYFATACKYETFFGIWSITLVIVNKLHN
jgi:thiaminase